MKTDVLIAEDLDAPAVRRLAESFKVDRQPGLWKEATLSVRLAEARCVMIRNQTKLTRAVIESAPELLAIGRVGVGLDNIDLQAANERGVVVIAPLDANAVSVAELTMGLIISLARKIPRSDRSTKSGGWDRLGCTGMELHGKTVTLCGFGRIGRLVAVRAKAFGMRTLVFDPFVKAGAPELLETGATLVTDVNEAAAQADFLSVHTPLTPQTRGMIGASIFERMKPSAFIINTARGGIVDEAALLGALQNGRIAGAALDVRETEPPVGPNPFAALENVILTPHIASFTVEAQTRTFEAVCADLERILRWEAAVNFVNFARPRK